jgi:hypothetical protein
MSEKLTPGALGLGIPAVRLKGTLAGALSAPAADLAQAERVALAALEPSALATLDPSARLIQPAPP